MQVRARFFFPKFEAIYFALVCCSALNVSLCARVAVIAGSRNCLESRRATDIFNAVFKDTIFVVNKILVERMFYFECTAKAFRQMLKSLAVYLAMLLKRLRIRHRVAFSLFIVRLDWRCKQSLGEVVWA